MSDYGRVSDDTGLSQQAAEPKEVSALTGFDPSREGLTCFGSGLDGLAREHGGWPKNTVVHTIEVLNGGGDQKDPQVMLEGSIPTGEKNGRATFKGCPRSSALKAVVRLSEYRAAIAMETQRVETPQSGSVAKP